MQTHGILYDTVCIYALTNDLPEWGRAGVALLEQAVRLHYRAVWIHPFENGNGRWARLLANVWLRRHEAPLIHWPEDNLRQHASPIRSEYLETLKTADDGDHDRLLKLHKPYQSR